MDLTNIIEKTYSKAVEIYRHLHMHPELSEEEVKTADYICQTLESHHIPYKRGIAGQGITALVAGKGPGCIGTRADMDALPVTEDSGLPYTSANSGVMHACGHDMHMAILLGTGIVLKEIEDQLPGSVKLIFQPAEETIGGAYQMIKEGVLTEPAVSAVIGLHVDPTCETGSILLRSGPMNAAVNDFTMVIKGKQCHGAQPERGIDPIVIAADIIMNLQTVASRFTPATNPVVVSIGRIQGGTACNIIPGEVMLQGTLRAIENETFRSIQERVQQLAAGIAAAYGASVTFSWMETPFPPLINDDSIVKIIEETADSCLGSGKVHHMAEPSMGADDFAFFTEAASGAYFNLGCTPAGKTAYPVHNEHFVADEEAILSGIKIEVHTALALLSKTSAK